MTDCDELIERQVMKKVVKWSEVREGEESKKTSVRKLSIACASLRRCIRVRLRPQSAGVSHTKCGN